MPAPETIHQLVQRFEDNSDAYRKPAYNEAQLRQEFLNPFFKALGWDIANNKGYAPKYREVIHEDSIHIKGSPNAKAPDYAFRLGGKRIFFVEAKKPAEDIQNTKEYAYQLKIYAWNTGLPLSILTDFEEFAVYDCRSKPNRTDSPAAGRILYIRYDEYLDKWDEIAGIFSPEAIRKGAFDKYAEDNTAKKGTIKVDDAFLQEIENWRILLARNIALRNEQVMNERQLNFAVQMTIDRIIFLRICEDRGIEPLNQLYELGKGKEVYNQLVALYQKADLKYNSGLFHFKAESGNQNHVDTFTPSLVIDDKVLKEIIKSLYYPCPYVFKELPVEILGQVYEQFLGKVIRLTPGHRAKVEEKPEVRKAGGVYYTPRYIVDYIVKNTVGELLNGKTPSEAGKLKIVDPACGSGSFLLGAFQYLMDWHEKYYLEHDPEKWSKGKNPRIIQTAEGDWQLTTDEKKRILVNNLHGVDIDSQAVEVTKLSLLLKVLEEETGQLSLGFERALPDLNDNIKCGNSLIGWDYFEGQLIPDEAEVARVNPFDWEKGFPQIFASEASGGFDAVIGNPPYVRQETLGNDKKYYQSLYQVYAGMADLYSYFIEKGINLLAPDGIFSYIVANKWLRARYGKPLRDWLKTKCIEEITDFGDLPVFEKATTYPCILRVSNKTPLMKPFVTNVDNLGFVSLEEYVEEYGDNVNQNKFEDDGWSLADSKTQSIFDKLQQNAIPLEKYVNGKIFRGIITGLNKAFVIDEETKKQLIEEDPRSQELIKPFAIGREIKRYQPIKNQHFLIFIPKGWTNSKTSKNAWDWFASEYPAMAKHLLLFEKKAKKRWDKGDYWWELRACDYYDEFDKPKITWGNLATTPKFCIDYDGYYINAPSVIISTEDLYLLGILNSNLCYYYISKIAAGRRGGFFEYKPVYVSKVPIHVIDRNNSNETAKHDQMVSLVTLMLELHKRTPQTPYEQERLEREIDVTDAQIDHLVYDLYGLTEAEIKIVEG
ncbi:MAG: TaqI-like C-terminal specificity domain-containing protein [Chloroflexota bacterium]|nr:TaqI-like C-terminal specificity domain-containing protein [Chloroflexota bacterium]